LRQKSNLEIQKPQIVSRPRASIMFWKGKNKNKKKSPFINWKTTRRKSLGILNL
jgi:hypothetical protein